MNKFIVSSVFMVLVCPAFSGNLLDKGRKNPKKLLLDLYASLYNQDQLPDYHRETFDRIDALEISGTDNITDAMIFLNLQVREQAKAQPISYKKKPSQLVIDEFPKYDDAAAAAHLVRLYQWRNGDNAVFGKHSDNIAEFASFLTVADKVDGVFDSFLRLPNLDEFYELLVEKDVPLVAICFNCREEDDWMDRRTMIQMDKLERELPKKLKKMRKSKASDEQKLAAILHFITANIEPSTDGWETDYWQTPVETLLVGEGDCEDFAILYVALAEFLGVQTSVVIGDIVTRDKSGKAEIQGHAWVDYRGRMIDPIMTTYRGPIDYKPQFLFNASVAGVVVPDHDDSLEEALAAK